MRILVTGSKGFVGRNLIAELKNRGYENILEFHRDSNINMLEEYTKECDFVFHLAGVNRPIDEKEYMKGNYGLTLKLIDSLKEHNNKAPILLASSIQAEKENPYGKSKKAGEDLLHTYGYDTGAKVLIYRLPNLFGKWCKPNYNSVVATFCHNIARGLDIQINDPEAKLSLAYIDDVLSEFINAMDAKESRLGDFCYIPITYSLTVGELAEKIFAFKRNRDTLLMPSLECEFDKALYGTYLSYLPKESFSYRLQKRQDNRGWLAEFIKSKGMGQIFVSKTQPGITRGNHWHHTKVEKFLVIQGEAVIKFRNLDSDEILDYKVNGDEPEVVDIPVGYTHSITNIGEGELITLFWACEIFDPENPDTYYLEV